MRKIIGKTGYKLISMDSFDWYHENDYIDCKIRRPDGTEEPKYKHADKWVLTEILSSIPEKYQCKLLCS